VEVHRVVRRCSHILLDNRFTDGGEVVSLKRRPPFTRQEDSRYSTTPEVLQTGGRCTYIYTSGVVVLLLESHVTPFPVLSEYSSGHLPLAHLQAMSP
jgi:hypothetical protein